MPVLFNSDGTQRNFGILELLVYRAAKMRGWFRSLGVGTKRNNRPLRDLLQREDKIGPAFTVNFQPLLLSEALILTAESSAARPQ